VAQLGGAHIACEGVSNVLTKALEWGRLMAYLEQSTRYIAYDARNGGRFRYYRDPDVLQSNLGTRYVGDLDRLFDTVKREKGSIDVLWASAGMGEPAVLGEITEEQFKRAFWINARGTLFTVQKALPLINDNGSIFMTGSNASLGAFPGWSLYAGSKAVQQAWARVWLNELSDRKIRVNVLTPGQVATAKQEELFDEATKAAFESLIPRGTMGRPEEIATVALFLASDDSSYVNGLELVADGGTTAI
jgi:NAD(P)-dependent dehydrogenase (short-subunit alcohol dehydrogenase family)